MKYFNLKAKPGRSVQLPGVGGSIQQVPEDSEALFPFTDDLRVQIERGDESDLASWSEVDLSKVDDKPAPSRKKEAE
ncbi:MAG: hypothetical protein AB7F96_16440 [Beijerinckiaceae bacterium]